MASSSLMHSSRASAPHMGVIADAEKWISDNLAPIKDRKGGGGGSGWASINTYTLEDGRELFVKASGSKNCQEMFLGEGLGLKALGVADSLAIPKVYHYDDGFDGGSYIVMEYLDIRGRPDPEAFGRAMA